QLAGVSPLSGRVLGLFAGVTVGIAPILNRHAGTSQVAAWTRARSASEGLKTEVYEYLAGGSAYTGADRDRQLGTRSRAIVAAVSDLLPHTAGIVPDSKPIPRYQGSTHTSPSGWTSRSTVTTDPRQTTTRRSPPGCASLASS